MLHMFLVEMSNEIFIKIKYKKKKDKKNVKERNQNRFVTVSNFRNFPQVQTKFGSIVSGLRPEQILKNLTKHACLDL